MVSLREAYGGEGPAYAVHGSDSTINAIFEGMSLDMFLMNNATLCHSCMINPCVNSASL